MSANTNNPYPAEFEDDDRISISENLNTLLDEWRLVLLVFLLVMMGAAGYLMTKVPVYSAAGIIQVSTSDATDAESILNMAAGRRSPVETEMQILRSRRILNGVIRDQSLNIVEKSARFSTEFGVTLGGKSPLSEDLKTLRRFVRQLTVADWRESSLRVRAKVIPGTGVAVQFSNGIGSHTVGFGETFIKKGVSFTVAHAGDIKSPFELEVYFLPDDIASKQALSHLRVDGFSTGGMDTNLVRVSFENPDRKTARDFVNGVMDRYMDFSLEWKTKRADRSAAFINGQLESLRAELHDAESKLQRFTEENGAVLLSEQAAQLIQNGSELSLEMRKTKVQEDLLGMVKMQMSRSMKNGTSASLSGDFFFENSSLSEAIGALNELELKRDVLLSEVTGAHPEVIRLGEQIGQVNRQVRDMVAASHRRIHERRMALSNELGGIQTSLMSFPDKERKLAVLKRNLGASQEMYSFLLGKLEETQILKASTTTDKRIIDKATTPPTHEEPKRPTVLLISGILGLLLGAGVVFGRRAIDPRVRDEEEAKKQSGLATYGVVPDLRDLGANTSDGIAPSDIWNSPKGPAAESFRTIRTNVEFAAVDGKPLQVIQITSSQAGEGKSTVISNLAIALSLAGHRVLIVDLDLRRPSLHRVLGASRAPGISDHVAGRAEIQVNRHPEYGIDFVAAGNEPPESQRMLGSDRVLELVANWREAYDYVLLDTPPLLVADSLVVSRFSDLVLFVIRPRFCRRDHLKLAMNTADRMDRVKGLVINGVATRRGGYYHYYRGSYYGSKTSETQEH